MKSKDWFVLEQDGKFYAVEDRHDQTIPRMKGGTIVGIVSFAKPVDAIEYITFVELNKPMRRNKP